MLRFPYQGHFGLGLNQEVYLDWDRNRKPFGRISAVWSHVHHVGGKFPGNKHISCSQVMKRLLENRAEGTIYISSSSWPEEEKKMGRSTAKQEG